VGVNEGGGGRGEKWPKPCMHIWIIKQFKKQNDKKENEPHAHDLLQNSELWAKMNASPIWKWW
jgi:hypothetical protein